MGRDIGTLQGIINGKRRERPKPPDPVAKKLDDACEDLHADCSADLHVVARFYGLDPDAIRKAFQTKYGYSVDE